MNSQPLVSIITPVYNGGKFINQAIGSVLQQTYQNWELIIVNDGSTDNSENEILKFDHKKIRYFKQENRGVSAARNLALQKMNGVYFCFLDADDILPQTSIESRILLFNEDNEIAFVDGTVEIWSSNFAHLLNKKKHTFSGNPFQQLIELDESVFFGLSWMIKRVPGYRYQFKEDMTHAEDLLFYISIANQGEYRATEEVVYKYQVDPKSAMKQLRGLEKGYGQLILEIEKRKDVSVTQIKMLRKKVKSIMFKSYLGAFQPLNAMNVVIHGCRA